MKRRAENFEYVKVVETKGAGYDVDESRRLDILKNWLIGGLPCGIIYVYEIWKNKVDPRVVIWVIGAY